MQNMSDRLSRTSTSTGSSWKSSAGTTRRAGSSRSRWTPAFTSCSRSPKRPAWSPTSTAPAGFRHAPTRIRIERKLAKVAYEHLIVFVDPASARQVWQWAKRLPGRPPAYREHAFYRDNIGEPLVQKLQPLAFDIDEDPSIVEVTGRTRKAFDVDRVTRRFYDRFKTEHTTFLRFVEGISDDGKREWYASLMLNRLMFVYFVQKKGFLAKDSDYLRNRLNDIQQLRGQGNFLSFYLSFLRRFFHEGLGRRPQDRDAELDALIGDVPYLNGGIFDVHELEREYADIEIPDEAFINLFDFFDAHQWHLDERRCAPTTRSTRTCWATSSRNTSTRNRMGAYYTKEDVTAYIAQNTIIPGCSTWPARTAPSLSGPTRRYGDC